MFDKMKLDDNLIDSERRDQDKKLVIDDRKIDPPEVGLRHKTRKYLTNLVVSVTYIIIINFRMEDFQVTTFFPRKLSSKKEEIL